MRALITVSKILCITTLCLWLAEACFLVTVQPGEIGVRQSNLSGVSDDDFEPGWHWRIPGIHKVILLPSSFEFLDYTADDAGPQQALQIRTKDNNIVQLDVSVPVRIRKGEANALVRDGNHVRDADGRYRFQRLAENTTVSVLREQLADLTSKDFYSTAQRLEVAGATLAVLNQELAPLHLEAEIVLIRAVRFRAEYEDQLQQIQLNEQNKLLDQARQKVAAKQQELDNYAQATNALASAREQDWVKRQADLERAYQIGFIDPETDTEVGAVRRKLESLTEPELAAVKAAAAEVFTLQPDEINENYLLGIKNIEAETRQYSRGVTAEANGIAERLAAEANQQIAEVQGEFERKLNALLSSPAGRAYVAWKAAEHVTFDETLTFSSRDGIPSVLRLRQFAQQFMNR